MADFSKSISESVNVFGLAPSTKWNAFQWGVDTWGEGLPNGIVKDVVKALAETQPSIDSISNDVEKVFGDQAAVDMSMTDTKLTDSAGYSYVFPGGTTDAEDQVRTDWTADTVGSPSWTSQAVRGTSWS